jgi:transcriptional regulator with XRE-family HTH domain
MADPAPAPFSAYVRHLREVHELKQEELAKRCTLSADTIRRLERGAFSPSLLTLRKLAKGFGLSVAQLFQGFEVEIDGDHGDETSDLAALVRGRGPKTMALILELVRVFLRALDGTGDEDPTTEP